MVAVVFIVGVVLFTALFLYLYLASTLQRKSSVQKQTAELAELLENSSSKDSARIVLTQLRSTNKKSNKPDILALEARAYFSLEDYNNALDKALELSQSSFLGTYFTRAGLTEFLAQIYENLGQHEEAYQEYLLLYQQSSSQAPQSADFLAKAAAQALKMYQVETARTLYEKALAIDPDHEVSLCQLGVIYYKRRLYTFAAQLLSRAMCIPKSKMNSELFYYLGSAMLSSSGPSNTVITYLQQATDSPEWSRKALPKLARIFALNKSYAAAANALTRFFQLQPDPKLPEAERLALLCLQAECFEKTDQFSFALAVWEEILENCEEQQNPAYSEAEAKVEEYRSLLQNPDLQCFMQGPEEEFLQLIQGFFAAETHPPIKQIEAYSEDFGVLLVVCYKPSVILSIMEVSLGSQATVQPPSLHIFLRYNRQLSPEQLLSIVAQHCREKGYINRPPIHLHSLQALPEYEESPYYNLYKHENFLEQLQDYFQTQSLKQSPAS